MPGPVSESFKGPSENSPYVPYWCYKNGPKLCPCGHHEGYHNSKGQCLHKSNCHCQGLPTNCLTSDIEFYT